MKRVVSAKCLKYEHSRTPKPSRNRKEAVQSSKAGFQIGGDEAFELNAAAEVVTNGADVFDAECQMGTSNHGAGDMAAGAEDLVVKSDFTGVSGKVREQDERIGGVESNADECQIAALLEG